MEIVVGDVFSKLLTSDHRALGIANKYCSARPEGYQFMAKFKRGHWDGFVSLMHGNQFPTGLLDQVLQGLQDAGYEPAVSRPAKQVPAATTIIQDVLHGISLRDYQVEAGNALLQESRGIAMMATNSGKTEVIAAMCWALPVKTIILTHRKELLHQTAERLISRLQIPCGRIGDGLMQPDRVTVAMIQTLSKQWPHFQSYFQDTVMVIVDECHHISSNMMMDILFKLRGPYRFGFSGTPLKYKALADLKLIAATGKIVYKVINREMVESGWSAKPIVNVVVVDDPKDGWGSAYGEAYKNLVVENKQRNTIISNIAQQRQQGIVLVIVSRVEHGRILNGLIPDSKFIFGGQSSDYRRSVLEMMRTTPGVYIATEILDEGVDVPAIDTVIMAGCGKSHVKVLQRIGRGLRQKQNGNNVLQVYDFLDDTNKYLLKHCEERANVYAREGFETKLIETTDCNIL